jgi:hypothetical protein
MRILWLTIDRSNRVAQHFDIFRSHVKQIADVVEIVKNPLNDREAHAWKVSKDLISGNVDNPNLVLDYLKQDHSFDFIFCDAFFAYYYEDWKSFGIPSAILIEDVHQEVPKAQVSRAAELGIETIFHRYNFAFHTFHPDARFNFNCFWLPHSIDTTRFKPAQLKSLDVLHVGVCPARYYPHRANAVEQLKEKPYFKQVTRPKEGGFRELKWPIDSEYSELIASAKICITGGSIYNAPVQKYVEIPASGTLLMSNWFDDLGLLGFIPGINMIEYTENSLVSIVEDLLKHDEKIDELSTAGLNLIIEKHTSQIRARQFINTLCQITRNSLEFPNTPPCSNQVNFRKSIKSRTYRRTISIQKSSTKPKPLHPKLNPNSRIVAGTGWKSRIK